MSSDCCHIAERLCSVRSQCLSSVAMEYVEDRLPWTFISLAAEVDLAEIVLYLRESIHAVTFN